MSDYVTDRAVRVLMQKCAPFHLLPMDALMLTAWAMKEGADKYGEDEWYKDDTSWIKHYKAAKRHMRRWSDGNSVDADSGAPALAHAIARLLIILQHEVNDKGVDDRSSHVERSW